MQIPKSWAGVTIQQFKDLSKLDKSDELDFSINTIAIICGMTVDEVESLPIAKIKEITNSLAWMNKMPEKFVNDFKLNGVKYIVDPSIQKISAAQYIDLNEYVKKGVTENLDNIMTVFCFPTSGIFRKKPSKYGQGYSLKATAELFNEQLTMDVCYPLSLFFCKLLNKSTPIIKDYLEKELEKLKAMKPKDLIPSGVG